MCIFSACHRYASSCAEHDGEKECGRPVSASCPGRCDQSHARNSAHLSSTYWAPTNASPATAAAAATATTTIEARGPQGRHHNTTVRVGAFRTENVSVFENSFLFLKYCTVHGYTFQWIQKSLVYQCCGVVCVAVSPPKAYCLICTLVSCFKEVLSVSMLCMPMFIFTSGSSAILGCPFCGLSIWLSLLHIVFWVNVNCFQEKTEKTRKFLKASIFIWYKNGCQWLLGAQSIDM